jgi:hypothetical protein
LVWLKKIFFLLGGIFPLFGNFTKKTVFWGFFSAKIGHFETSSIYYESAQKTLPENVHFFD